MPDHRHHPEKRTWADQYWSAQLKAAESRQKWLWGDSSFPEIGFLLRLFTFGIRMVLLPFGIAFKAWRRGRKHQAFRSYLRGEEPR